MHKWILWIKNHMRITSRSPIPTDMMKGFKYLLSWGEIRLRILVQALSGEHWPMNRKHIYAKMAAIFVTQCYAYKMHETMKIWPRPLTTPSTGTQFLSRIPNTWFYSLRGIMAMVKIRFEDPCQVILMNCLLHDLWAMGSAINAPI
jgi:hypothetical protein